jgi:acyl-CoA synthetase (AMP-forming)/AMP-acid ligase II
MERRATSLHQKVKIAREDGDFEPETVVDFFKRTVENYPKHHALASRDSKGAPRRLSYRDYRNCVEKIAKVFIKLGLEQRGVVAILAWNCPEWVIAALGAIHCG